MEDPRCRKCAFRVCGGVRGARAVGSPRRVRVILLGAGPLVLSQMEHPPVEDPPRRELSRSMSGGMRGLEPACAPRPPPVIPA